MSTPAVKLLLVPSTRQKRQKRDRRHGTDARRLKRSADRDVLAQRQARAFLREVVARGRRRGAIASGESCPCRSAFWVGAPLRRRRHAAYGGVFPAPLALGRDTRSGSEHRNAVSGAWVIPRSASVRASDLSFVASDGWTAPTIA